MELTGRELDNEVALAIGWKVMNDPEIGVWWKAPKGDPDCDGFESADNPPPYSTSTDAALRAYEEFRKQRGDKCLLQLTEIGRAVGNWEARITWYLIEEDDVDCDDSLPKAICLAILEAAKRETT